jgi:NADH-quinone oxidoreductase subunit G
MSDEKVTLTIDGREVTVPKGTLIVDAAKQVGIEIPVFCYHPKLEPVGMCRMCLVEIGRPQRDRSTGEPVLDDAGNLVIQFGPNLETACTTPVGEGWQVRVTSERALEGRKQILEYLLTSHPLDCPICDKGGECPLQNLTLAHGPGKSRFLLDEKMHLAKHMPLGDLIVLDRERCIQCARCIRFQEEIVDDPVLGFSQRGRHLQIVTHSEPGFDSYFSGNTTDICPVGALTTTDFRFGARPWELNAIASICPHCPVGCNISVNTRREAKTGGRDVVKRVIPRQNEAVNEIWICDKGRFAHHFGASPQRVVHPMVRENGEFIEVSWEKALSRAADGLKKAAEGGGVVGLAGGRAANEDLYAFQSLISGLNGSSFLDERMGGGDVVGKVGVGTGSSFSDLGSGDAILVVASDLHEEAPIWWLRVQNAAKRGAALIVANARPTRLEKFAAHVVRYPYGAAPHTILGMLYAVTNDGAWKAFSGGDDVQGAVKAFVESENAVVIYGQDGLDLAGSEALARACANLLIESEHVGKSNNGLIAVWPRNNTQGAWDLGFRPSESDLQDEIARAGALYTMAADPVGDSPAVAEALPDNVFVVVQELFLTATAERADVVFPACSFLEREGTFTSGERRVQRFYAALAPMGESKPDWWILKSLAEKVGMEVKGSTTAALFSEIAASIPDYAGLGYQDLAVPETSWPPVGGDDLYFGGTAYRNEQGIGAKLASEAERGEMDAIEWIDPGPVPETEGMILIPIAKLYDHGTTVMPSEVLKPRLASKSLSINPSDAHRLGIETRGPIEIRWDGRVEQLTADIDETVPSGMALMARSLGVPLHTPLQVHIDPVEGQEDA